MSTLTKVLIVLITIFSVFLCGIVATYVVNAEHHRNIATKNRNDLMAAERQRDGAQRAQEQAEAEAKAREKDLNAQIVALTAKATKLEGELDTLNRAKAALDTEHAGMMAAVRTATTGEQEQRALFVAAQKEVERLRAEQIQRQAELDEINQMLVAKLTLISEMDGAIRQLTQENQDLGNRLNQYLAQYGKAATRPATTVAARGTAAQPAPVQPAVSTPGQTRDIGLNGKITAVDAKNQLAEISIGSAAGVRQDMRFYVIRGDRFVADIQIREVQPDKAVGSIDLVQTGMQPQPGDKVTTNL